MATRDEVVFNGPGPGASATFRRVGCGECGRGVERVDIECPAREPDGPTTTQSVTGFAAEAIWDMVSAARWRQRGL